MGTETDVFQGMPRGIGRGGLGIGEMVALFWHCVARRPEGLTRERLGEAVAERGLAAATPVLRVLLQQILKGR